MNTNNLESGDNRENINYYIGAFNEFNDMLTALTLRDPMTREAILNASYKDLLTLRVLAYDAERLTNILLDNRILKATGTEARAVADSPLTYE